MNGDKGFFSRLFDISFSEFITTEIIKILYVLAIIAAVIIAVGSIVRGFSGSVGYGIATLIVSVILFFVYVLVARVWLEIMIVIFRIAEDTRKLAERGESKESGE